MQPMHATRQAQFAFLQSSALFAGLQETNLLRLANSGRFVRVPKGEYFFLQSDPSESIYLLRSGSVVVVLNGADGRELVISELGPGDCFGELSLLTNQQRSAGALAREASEALELSGRVFMAALDAEPRLLRRLLEITAERLRTAHEREGALAFLDAPARVARVILELDEADRQGPDKGYITLSQEEVARRTGVARQTVARNLGQWRERGWLLTGRGRIMLLNRGALREVEAQSQT